MRGFWPMTPEAATQGIKDALLMTIIAGEYILMFAGVLLLVKIILDVLHGSQEAE